MSRNHLKSSNTKNQIPHLELTHDQRARCSAGKDLDSPPIQINESRPLELPHDRLAFTLQKCREASGKSVYRLAGDSGVSSVNIWKMERGERQNVTRETLLLLSLAMVLNANQVDQVVEVANEILNAAGLKMLRAPWEPHVKKAPGQTPSDNGKLKV